MFLDSGTHMFGHNPLGIPMDNNLLISSSPQEFVQMWLDTVCTHDASAIITTQTLN
jgi:hypothetical protein